jgi:hypothetical protein
MFALQCNGVTDKLRQYFKQGLAFPSGLRPCMRQHLITDYRGRLVARAKFRHVRGGRPSYTEELG